MRIFALPYFVFFHVLLFHIGYSTSIYILNITNLVENDSQFDLHYVFYGSSSNFRKNFEFLYDTVNNGITFTRNTKMVHYLFTRKKTFIKFRKIPRHNIYLLYDPSFSDCEFALYNYDGFKVIVHHLIT